jgi:hypothetical protein
LNKTIPPELETIVLKAIEKNPADRYATAQELADDLRRYLEDKPIRARRPTLIHRARKWARRHRAVVLAASALALTVLVLGGAVLWRELRQRDAAEASVGAALERVEWLQGQERYEEALGVLAVADGQLEGRSLGALRERVRNLQRDVEMLARLENAHQQVVATAKNSRWNWAGSVRLSAEAFRWYGRQVRIGILNPKPTTWDGFQIRPTGIRILASPPRCLTRMHLPHS